MGNLIQLIILAILLNLLVISGDRTAERVLVVSFLIFTLDWRYRNG